MGADLPKVVGNRRHADFLFHDPEGDVAWLGSEYQVTAENNAMCSAPKLFNALRKLRRLMDETLGPQPVQRRAI